MQYKTDEGSLSTTLVQLVFGTDLTYRASVKPNSCWFSTSPLMSAPRFPAYLQPQLSCKRMSAAPSLTPLRMLSTAWGRFLSVIGCRTEQNIRTWKQRWLPGVRSDMHANFTTTALLLSHFDELVQTVDPMLDDRYWGCCAR